MFEPSIKEQIEAHTYIGEVGYFDQILGLNICGGAHCYSGINRDPCNYCIGNIKWNREEISKLTWENLEETIIIKQMLGDIQMVDT